MSQSSSLSRIHDIARALGKVEQSAKENVSSRNSDNDAEMKQQLDAIVKMIEAEACLQVINKCENILLLPLIRKAETLGVKDLWRKVHDVQMYPFAHQMIVFGKSSDPLLGALQSADNERYDLKDGNPDRDLEDRFQRLKAAYDAKFELKNLHIDPAEVKKDARTLEDEIRSVEDRIFNQDYSAKGGRRLSTISENPSAKKNDADLKAELAEKKAVLAYVKAMENVAPLLGGFSAKPTEPKV